MTYPCFEFWSMYLFEICVCLCPTYHIWITGQRNCMQGVCVCAGKFECKFDSFQVLRLRMKVVQVCKCQCTSQVVQVSERYSTSYPGLWLLKYNLSRFVIATAQLVQVSERYSTSYPGLWVVQHNLSRFLRGTAQVIQVCEWYSTICPDFLKV